MVVCTLQKLTRIKKAPESIGRVIVFLGSLYRLSHLEDRKIHRDYHAADQHAQHNHDHWFHQTGKCFHRVIDFLFEEVGNLAEHPVQRPGFFADRHHLNDHIGKYIGICHRDSQAYTGAYFLLNFLGGFKVNLVASSTGNRVQGFNEGNARREHGRQRACPARNRRFAYQRTKDGYLQEQTIHDILHLDRTFPGIEEKPDAEAYTAKDRPPVLHEEIRNRHYEERWRRQICPKAREQVLKCGNHENHDDRGYDECHHDDRYGVEERRLYFALYGQYLFFVRRQAIEQAIQDTGLLSRLHQVAEQGVEIQRVFAKGVSKAVSGFDFVLDVHQQLANGRIRVPLADNVECLKQRHTGLHHCGKLTRKQGDVFLRDFSAAASALALHLEYSDSLPAQLRQDYVLASGTHVALDQFPGLVFAFPEKGIFLDPIPCCRCGSHSFTSSPHACSPPTAYQERQFVNDAPASP